MDEFNLEMEDFFGEDLEELREMGGLEEEEEFPHPVENFEESVGEVEETPNTFIEEEKSKDKPQTQTTTVDRYSSTTLSYPCFVLDGNKELPNHIITALSRMIESSLAVDDTIKVYLKDPSKGLLSLGGVSPAQVRAFIDLIGMGNFDAYFEKSYPLHGDMIYVLSS